jgi:hypothetical protein
VNDAIIFLVGTIVTLMVAAAVTLLFWGAANEPRPGEPLETPLASVSGATGFRQER